MKEDILSKIVYHVLVVFLGLIIFAFGAVLGNLIAKSAIEEVVKTKIDTFYVHHIDTIKVDSIVYKEKKVLDTLYLHDTILVKEQKVYEDSLSRIYISGIEPQLDSIYYFIPRDTIFINKETVIYRNVKKHFNFGIGVGGYLGAGVGYNPMKGTFGVNAPEVGVGVIIGFVYTP